MSKLDEFFDDLDAKAKAATPGPRSAEMSVWATGYESGPNGKAPTVPLPTGFIVGQDGVEISRYRRCGSHEAEWPNLADLDLAVVCDPDTIRLLVAVARAARYGHDDEGYSNDGPMGCGGNQCALCESLAALKRHAEGVRP